MTFRLARMDFLIRLLTAALLVLPLLFLAIALLANTFLLLPTAFLVVVYVWIALWFRPTRFVVGPRALEIVWPLRRREIPREDITGVRLVDKHALRGEVGWAMRMGAGGLGGAFGWLWTQKRGVVRMYIARTDGLVWIERRSDRPWLITPERPDAFVRTLSSALCLILALLLAGCATGGVPVPQPTRTVRLVMAVDDAFRAYTAWEAELRRAVANVSEIYENRVGIRYEVVRIVPWPQVGVVRQELFDRLAVLAKDDADIVVGVSGGCANTHLLGVARIFAGPAIVTTGCPHPGRPGFSLEQLLVHELAHVFGVFHPAGGVSVMRSGPAIAFDSQMLRVLRLTRTMDLSRGVEGLDAATRDAYQRIWAEGHAAGEPNGLAVATRNLGRFEATSGRLDAALPLFERATQIDPAWDQPFVDLGAWHVRTQHYDEAVRYFTAAIERAPKRTDVRIMRAEALDALGRTADARSQLEEVAKLDPKSALPHMRLGLMDLRTGQLPPAEQHLRDAIRIDPKLAEAHDQLAVVLALQGRLEESVAAARTAVQLKPDVAAAHGNLGTALARMGRVDEAIVEYRRSLTIDPLFIASRYNLVAALLRQSRGTEAIPEAQALVSQDPRSSKAWELLVGALVVAGRRPEAALEAQRAQSLGITLSPEVLQSLRDTQR
jgi:tetratricopeptide (TPR) repeat protein